MRGSERPLFPNPDIEEPGGSDALTTYPAEDRDLWISPSRRTSAEFIAKADTCLRNATEVEEKLGLEEATYIYEEAMRSYLGALVSPGASEVEMDYEFYLKIAGTQAKLAGSRSLRPYRERRTFNHIGPHGKQIVRGLSRAEDLFASSEEAYERALELAGGRQAPHEVYAKIVSQRSSMYALLGRYKEEVGDKSAGQTKIAEAINDLRGARTLVDGDIPPELARQVDEQITEAHEVLMGERSLDGTHRTLSESLVELAKS